LPAACWRWRWPAGLLPAGAACWRCLLPAACCLLPAGLLALALALALACWPAC